MKLPSAARYAAWLGLIRILTGVVWLAHGIPKFTHSAAFMPPGGIIAGYVSRGVALTTGPYHNFLTGVVQPNLPLFAELVRLGEVLVGISLVLGALTRVGGLFGIVLAADYIAARGHVLSSATLQSPDFSLLLLSAIALLLPTGRFFGIDGLFGRTKRPSTTVRAEFVPEPPMSGPTASPNP
ncbi:MAG TPA: TQO small subunit DoxD [Candidatus Tumulicola sp.]|jgi:thiosulfate dehydrogenase [quinone] large subunit